MTKTVKNTLKCVLALFLIAVISVSLLSIANKFLKVDTTLDTKTANLINEIAPTGYDNASAYSQGAIKMVDVTTETYGITIDAFNDSYTASKAQVLAVYTSQHKDTGVVTFVIEATAKGRDGDISTLVAFDGDKKISGVKVKSQMESYWDRASQTIDDFYENLKGQSGTVTTGSVAGLTGTTETKGGIIGGVNAACSMIRQMNTATEVGDE